MRTPNRPLAIATALLTAAVLVHASAFAQAGGSTSARQNRIVGLWDVGVNVKHCISGTPLFTFLAMHKFELGGTGQIVPAGNPAALSAHLLVWQHLEGNNYEWAAKFYRFDNGNANPPTGWTIIRSQVSISEDSTLYGGSGVASGYDMNGNFLFASCPEIAGVRFDPNA